MEKTKHILKTLLLGIIAGGCICLGGFLNVLMNTYIPNIYGKLLGSFLFTIGLILICFFKFNLYTGKIGYVLDRKNYLDLCVMLVGNLIGTILIGSLMYLIFNGNEKIMNTVNKIILVKEENSTLNLTISGILCGILVYSAVDLFAKSKNVFLKIIFIIIPIMLFVFLGYDHCIANSFYLAFGQIWDENLIIVMVPVIFGNSLGSIIMNKICENKLVNK